MLNKRGQFYLIAAIIIVGVLFGLTAIYNSASSQKEDSKVYDLSKEVDFESARVIDSGIFYGRNQSEINDYLYRLIEYYGKTNPPSNIVLLYGNTKGFYLVNLTHPSHGNVQINLGSSSGISVTGLATNLAPIDISSGKVQIVLNKNAPPLIFNVGNEAQNIYVVVDKELNGERYISAQK